MKWNLTNPENLANQRIGASPLARFFALKPQVFDDGLKTEAAYNIRSCANRQDLFLVLHVFCIPPNHHQILVQPTGEKPNLNWPN
jgi:hypothetical protein